MEYPVKSDPNRLPNCNEIFFPSLFSGSVCFSQTIQIEQNAISSIFSSKHCNIVWKLSEVRNFKWNYIIHCGMRFGWNRYDGCLGNDNVADKRRSPSYDMICSSSRPFSKLLLRRRLIYFRLSSVCINHIQTIPCHRKAGEGFERRLWTKKNGRGWRVAFTFRFANCSGVSLSIYHSFVKTYPKEYFHQHLLIVLDHHQVS